jgi:hypothetical protein
VIHPFPEAQTNAIFDAMWPLLEVAVTEAKKKVSAPESARRSVEEILEESL